MISDFVNFCKIPTMEKRTHKKTKATVLQMQKPSQEEHDLFTFKSEYLMNNPYFDFHEINCEDYFDKVFCRPGHSNLPFEAEQCEEYKEWKRQYEEGLTEWLHGGGKRAEYKPNIDYSKIKKFRLNPIVLYFEQRRDKATDEPIVDENGNKLCIPKHRIILLDKEDPEHLGYNTDILEGADFAIMAPVTYIGGSNKVENCRWCFGIVLDLDYVGKQEIVNTIFHMTVVTLGAINNHEKVQLFPVANIITNSGHGLHLYFLFKEPIDIHLDNQRKLLEKLKRGLIQLCWRPGDTSLNKTPEAIQYQGVIQGYRIPGSLTKFGEPVRSFYNEDSHYFTIRELNKFVGKGFQLKEDELTALENGFPYKPDRVTLAEAKERWPEWYQERIVEGRPPKEWYTKRRLYDYWVGLIMAYNTPIAVGHRYYCLQAIAVLGRKCNIPREEVEAVILSQVDRMEALTGPEDGSNHFLKSDAEAALMAYDDPKSMRISWRYIVGRSGLSAFITEQKKRLGTETLRRNRNQKDHLQRARAIRDIDHPNGSWINRAGRSKGSFIKCEDSPAAKKVAEWRRAHPLSTNKSGCAKDTGLTRPTVRKWWNGDNEQAMKQWEKQRNSTTDEPIIRKAMPDDPFEGFIKEDGLFLVDPSKLKTEEDYKRATELLQEAIKKLKK